jgi:hypothetical protein
MIADHKFSPVYADQMFLIPYKSHLDVVQLEKSFVCSLSWHDSSTRQELSNELSPEKIGPELSVFRFSAMSPHRFWLQWNRCSILVGFFNHPRQCKMGVFNHPRQCKMTLGRVYY